MVATPHSRCNKVAAIPWPSVSTAEPKASVDAIWEAGGASYPCEAKVEDQLSPPTASKGSFLVRRPDTGVGDLSLWGMFGSGTRAIPKAPTITSYITEQYRPNDIEQFLQACTSALFVAIDRRPDLTTLFFKNVARPLSKQTCIDVTLFAPCVTSDVTYTRDNSNAAWDQNVRVIEGRKVRGAPRWLVERMEALRKLPSPTLEQVETSFRASEEIRSRNEGSLGSYRNGRKPEAT